MNNKKKSFLRLWCKIAVKNSNSPTLQLCRPPYGHLANARHRWGRLGATKGPTFFCKQTSEKINKGHLVTWFHGISTLNSISLILNLYQNSALFSPVYIFFRHPLCTVNLNNKIHCHWKYSWIRSYRLREINRWIRYTYSDNSNKNAVLMPFRQY